MSATDESIGSSVSGIVNFDVENALDLLDSDNGTNDAFNDLGGTFDGGSSVDEFDWCSKFFLGRTVFIGNTDAKIVIGYTP